MFAKVGILIALHKTGIENALERLVRVLESWGVKVCLPIEGAELLGRTSSVPLEQLADSDLLIALGGDGCVLSAARLAAPKGTPILGVRVEGFGFLSEVELENTEQALKRIKANDFWLEERRMLQAKLHRKEILLWSDIGLNDAMVIKSHPLPLPYWEVWVNEELLACYPADGVIVSTPTGSTGYALSAGGPVLAPDVQGLLLMPMYAHTLTLRPFVLSPQVTVRIRLLPQRRPVEGEIRVDGLLGHPVLPDDWTTITISPHRVRIVRFKGSSFFERLHQKLRWGERQWGSSYRSNS